MSHFTFFHYVASGPFWSVKVLKGVVGRGGVISYSRTHTSYLIPHTIYMKKQSGQQINVQIGSGITKRRALMEPRNSITYKGPLDCVIKTLRTEGIRGLYKGLVPTLARLTPHTVILWVVQENCLEKLWDFC